MAIHKMVIAKWGNSLALRLPAQAAKALGVGEGDSLVAQVDAGGRLILSAEGRAIGKAEARRMRGFLSRQKVTPPVVGEMRRAARA